MYICQLTPRKLKATYEDAGNAVRAYAHCWSWWSSNGHRWVACSKIFWDMLPIHGRWMTSVTSTAMQRVRRKLAGDRRSGSTLGLDLWKAQEGTPRYLWSPSSTYKLGFPLLFPFYWCSWQCYLFVFLSLADFNYRKRKKIIWTLRQQLDLQWCAHSRKHHPRQSCYLHRVSDRGDQGPDHSSDLAWYLMAWCLHCISVGTLSYSI